jgi:hypothetical protein
MIYMPYDNMSCAWPFSEVGNKENAADRDNDERHELQYILLLVS